MKSIAIGMLGITLLGGSAIAQTTQEQAQILRDFETRVAEYAHRERCIGHVAPTASMSLPQIFTLPVATVFRQVIANAMTDSANAARMDAPVSYVPQAGRPTAFEPFPATELYDFPPVLSNALPPLPRPLEYRLIGDDLVLRDSDADVIVAVLRDAVGHVATVRR